MKLDLSFSLDEQEKYFSQMKGQMGSRRKRGIAAHNTPSAPPRSRRCCFRLHSGQSPFIR